MPLEDAVAYAFADPEPELEATDTGAENQAAGRRDDGLTAREIEVLRLLVEGRSNPQIADALFISRKTASNHVTSILAKLGVESRTAAASFAVRQGLVQDHPAPPDQGA